MVDGYTSCFVHRLQATTDVRLLFSAPPRLSHQLAQDGVGMSSTLNWIQFEEAISRASDTFVITSHAELSGSRQGSRRITVAGKDVKSPQEAVEICPNVRQQMRQNTRQLQQYARGSC